MNSEVNNGETNQLCTSGGGGGNSTTEVTAIFLYISVYMVAEISTFFSWQEKNEEISATMLCLFLILHFRCDTVSKMQQQHSANILETSKCSLWKRKNYKHSL